MRFFSLVFALLFSSLQLLAVDQKVVTGVVLLSDQKVPDFKKITQKLSSAWDTEVDSLIINDKTALFVANGATISMAYFDYPDKSDDMMAAAGISWLWKNAEQEALAHQGQVVISIIGDNRRGLELYMLFTRCAAATLESTNSVGVFMNSQYLLLEKGYYLTAADNLKKQFSLPIYCWVYFGVMEEDGMNGGYTYGMFEFGSKEIEIRRSDASVQDLHGVLYEAAQQSIKDRVIWRAGDQFKTSSGDRIEFASGTGDYLQEEVLKIEY